MSKIIVYTLRILLVLGGLFCLNMRGKPLMEVISIKANGHLVEGRIIGFTDKRTEQNILPENYMNNYCRYIYIKPVFRYPVITGSIDSLDGNATTAILLPWSDFELNDRIAVVLKKEDPAKAFIFSKGLIFTDVILIVICILMIKIGATGKLM